MKSVVLPAQVTTIEDTIAGSLSLTQLVIVVSPILLSAVIIGLLPPWLKISWYKAILCGLSCLILLPLAIRIKSRLVLGWLRMWLTYRRRPRLHLSSIDPLCDYCFKPPSVEATKEPEISESIEEIASLSLPDQQQAILAFRQHRLSISYKKGVIYAMVPKKR